MKIIITIIASMTLINSIYAQSILMQQISSQGGQMTGTDGTILIYSLGAIASSSISSEDNSIRLDQGMSISCDLTSQCIKVGFEDALSYPRVEIYPNPSNGDIYLDGSAYDMYSYKLVSPSGQTLAEELIRDASISLEPYAAGIYILHILNREGEIGSIIKVIRQN